jgi:ABC-type uncharacterized transport system permease subunit
MKKRQILASSLGLVTALAIGLIALWLQGYPPLESYASLFRYSLLSKASLLSTLNRATLLILLGLSATTAFASGAVNLGQAGQFLIGAMSVTVFGLYVNLPSIIMIPLSIAIALVVGALYAGIAAYLRSRFGMNEFITSLMLNFIADYFTLYLISGPLLEQGKTSPTTPMTNPGGWLPMYGDFDCGFIVAIATFAFVYGLWNRSKLGYEWTVMGRNPVFSRIGGCHNEENFTKAMLFSGALAGLAGALIVMGGVQHRFFKGIGGNYAWDGVMIAIVANSKVVATAIYALFFSVLQTGAMGMELETAVPSEFVLVLQAITVLFVVASRESTQTLIDRFLASIRAKKIKANLNAAPEETNHAPLN